MNILKRINFFKGLFMQAEDWQAEQNYHMQKQRDHNLYLHSPGVANLDEGMLSVSVIKNGTEFSIAPGYAVDGNGNDLCVPNTVTKTIPARGAFDPPNIVYVTIKRDDLDDDKRANDENPTYTGYAFKVENTLVEISTQQPDNKERIELARIALTAKGTEIKNAADPFNPGNDEIDMTHVLEAGTRIKRKRQDITMEDLSEKTVSGEIDVAVHFPKEKNVPGFLIEIFDDLDYEPVYMVHTQVMGQGCVQWWIECNTNNNRNEFHLRFKNVSVDTVRVKYKVYRMRTKPK